jgi:hypothetical protein
MCYEENQYLHENSNLNHFVHFIFFDSYRPKYFTMHSHFIMMFSACSFSCKKKCLPVFHQCHNLKVTIIYLLIYLVLLYSVAIAQCPPN